MMASRVCGWLPLLQLLLLNAAGPVLSAGLHSSHAAEEGGPYRPFLGRLLPPRGSPARYLDTSDLGGRHLPSREQSFDLQPLDGGREELQSTDIDRYEVEPIDDDWVQIAPGRDSAEDQYEPAWPGAEPLEDDWPPLRPPQEEDIWPPSPLRDSDDDDWVQIGSPDDGDWAAQNRPGHWQGGWSENRDEIGPDDDLSEPDWAPFSRSDVASDRSDSYLEPDQESEQELEQGPEQRQEQDQYQWPQERQADLESELSQSRPDSPVPDADTARQLHAIRHAFLHQAEASSGDQQGPQGAQQGAQQRAQQRAQQGAQQAAQQGPQGAQQRAQQEPQQGPRAAALWSSPSGQRLNMRKRLAAGSGGGGGGGGRHRYMPWLLIAGIAVGSVAAVLGAIYVTRRVRGGPGKVVTQQWIPHNVLRMSTGSADIQPATGGARQGDPTAEPIRIKAKGLLERRCSNSSLTIQLQQAEDDGEPVVVTSPATHSEAAEYLASAGNRLSRRELRQTEESVAALQAEFWDIPLNFSDKGDIVGSSTKNRYKTVVPNEHTRVTLPGVNEDPLTSYINANWIRGYDNEERAYIATQGPLAHTLEDFWQMVLSRRAPAVVMITKLRENSRIKCAGYLPETRQKATFGKIEVTVKRILPRNGYTLRQITVKRGKEQLQLQHFWFTAWPDHRTPDDSQQLLQMAAEVEAARRDSEGNPTGPVVVHCSAGIGRTGCFIAVSIGTSQLMEEGGVDVLGIVCGMRKDRGGMVQTAEQYIFIHRALRDFEASLPALEALARPAN